MVVRLFCILFFISNLVKSQDYPILSLDTNGTKLVIFTEPQAQKIDSMLILVILLLTISSKTIS